MISDELNFLINQSGNFHAKYTYVLQLSSTTDWVQPFILKLCAQGENAFSLQQLDNEIQRLRDVAILKESHHVAPDKSSARKKVEVARYDPEQLPTELKDVDTEIRSLYSANRILRGKLQQIHYDYGGRLRQRISKISRQESATFAMELVENDKRIAELYTKIDYFLQTGRIMGKTEENSELQKVTLWLSKILELNNYVKKCDTFFRKYNRYQNPIKYQEACDTLSQIKEYLLSKGL